MISFYQEEGVSLPSVATWFGFFHRVGTMAVDWIGFAYALLLVFGGFVGYSRKG